MSRFIVITGCSGGGKSTLLNELAWRGFPVAQEPGRRIIAEETQRGGDALPWVSMEAFARRAITMALADRDAATQQVGWVFFDRGLIDAATALEHATGKRFVTMFCGGHRYHPKVFIAEPWPEIWHNDADRRHDFVEAVAEYERLRAAYSGLGYELVPLPKVSVEERADFIAEQIAVACP